MCTVEPVLTFYHRGRLRRSLDTGGGSAEVSSRRRAVGSIRRVQFGGWWPSKAADRPRRVADRIGFVVRSSVGLKTETNALEKILRGIKLAFSSHRLGERWYLFTWPTNGAGPFFKK